MTYKSERQHMYEKRLFETGTYAVQVTIGEETGTTCNDRSTSLPPCLLSVLNRSIVDRISCAVVFDCWLESAWLQKIVNCHDWWSSRLSVTGNELMIAIAQFLSGNSIWSIYSAMPRVPNCTDAPQCASVVRTIFSVWKMTYRRHDRLAQVSKAAVQQFARGGTWTRDWLRRF